uniref:Uncharacterized protein n=1 Tax=Lepeophtheirus salmonis TaxID=72036 RepID=A0A0K2UAM6_LEPSM
MVGRADDLRKRSPSKKAQVTRAVNSINSLCISLLAWKTSEGKLFLDEARIRLQKAYESLELMDIDPDQTDEYNSQLEEYNYLLAEIHPG